MSLQKLRKISSIADLTPEEQVAILKSIDTVPCIPFNMKFLEKYKDQIDVDFSKVKNEDKDRMFLLSPEMVRSLMMHDYDALRGLCLVLNVKAIYRKSWEAFMIDKDHMEMNLDEHRARCEMEYKDCESIKTKESEK